MTEEVIRYKDGRRATRPIETAAETRARESKEAVAAAPDLAAASRARGRKPGETDDAYAKRMADLRKPKPMPGADKPPSERGLVGNINPSKAADAIEKNK